MKKMTSVLALLTIMMGLSTSVKAQDVTHYDKPSDLKVNQAILTLKDIEEYRVLNFMMTSGGKASLLFPEWLREKVNGYAQAVARANEVQEKRKIVKS